MKTQESKVSHTLGPWSISGHGIMAQIRYGKASRIETVATVYPRSEVDKANARLIAAAPELLSACKEICSAVADCLPPSGDGELDVLYYKSKLVAIDLAAGKCSAAITKAESNAT